jgi:hypothetical protein
MYIHSSFCDKFTVSYFAQCSEILVVEKVRTEFDREALDGGAARQLATLDCMGKHRCSASHESVPQAEGPAEASKEDRSHRQPISWTGEFPSMGNESSLQGWEVISSLKQSPQTAGQAPRG